MNLQNCALGEDGWLTGAQACPSPNRNDRPPGEEVSLLVVHNISLPPGQFGTGDVQALFCNTLDCSRHPYFEALRGLEVSAHFLIDREGLITQFVSCDERAWHAGISSWAGRKDCNDYSIGVELEGEDRVPYTAPQYGSLATLIHLLRQRYPQLASGGIAGHSDIAPGRKTDPGPAFDWRELRQALRGQCVVSRTPGV